MIKASYRKTPDIYPIDDIRVIDGDTIHAWVRLPFDQQVQKRIRLKGWWAAEVASPWGNDALKAKALLEAWVRGKALWLHAPSCRLDKFGRIVGHLMHDNRIIDPKEVLGQLQLSEAEHPRRSDATRASKRTPTPVHGTGCPKCGDAWGDDTGCVLCCPAPPYRF
jgi:hypothetical protein